MLTLLPILRTWFAPCLAAILLGVTAAPGQDQAAGGSSLPIGLLNIERIAQSHKPTLERLKALQEDAQELQKSATLKQSELENVSADLQKAVRGSAEFQKLQNQLSRLQRELQTFVQEGQQKLREKDLKLSLSLHREIDEVLKPYCKAKGIRLVVRTNTTSLDENQPPQQILQTVNRAILYEDGLDITDDVLKLLEERTAKGKP
jgi:Skp family chaperone for outer membrane proteins